MNDTARRLRRRQRNSKRLVAFLANRPDEPQIQIFLNAMFLVRPSVIPDPLRRPSEVIRQGARDAVMLEASQDPRNAVRGPRKAVVGGRELRWGVLDPDAGAPQTERQFREARFRRFRIFMADMLTSLTAEQRETLVRNLRDYAEDFKAIAS